MNDDEFYQLSINKLIIQIMRNGYQPGFLGKEDKFIIELPRPSLALEGDILNPPGLPEGETVVPYINYSLLMSKSTRQALYSAANIDSSQMKRVPSRQGRRWFIDNRVGRDNQIPNYPYTGTQWDRGHLTRRTAVTWGKTQDIAVNASNDSCAYTNACMQHENFNEDEWRAVEELVSQFKFSDQLTVMTGPVFTKADRFYIRNFGDYPVRIPTAFWKIISYVKNGELETLAYIFFQDIDAIKSDRGKDLVNLKETQVTTTEVSTWTGLIFDPKQYESNSLKFYDGPEFISAQGYSNILKREGDTLTLDEGIAEYESIKAIRKKIPLEDFYALIEDISWI